MKRLKKWKSNFSRRKTTRLCTHLLPFQIKYKFHTGPFKSHEWPRQNLFLRYKYNIKVISDMNKEKYQFGDNYLIQY